MKPIVIALSLLAACDSSAVTESMDPRTTVEGDWKGEVVSDGGRFPVEITMEEVRTVVTGSGVVRLLDRERQFEIAMGDYLHPLLNLDLSFSDAAPPFGNLDGTVNVNRDEVRGTMAGPGFSGPVELVLERQ